MRQKHILVVGAGSVGKRHARNLVSLGCRISAIDPRRERVEDLAKDVELISSAETMEKALAQAKDIDGVAICSPPVFHLDQCMTALKLKLPILLEKPVSPDKASADKLKKEVESTGVPLVLGYSWRWWPPLLKVKELLSQNSIGTIRHVRFVMSAHLADWHPWENYWDFFMAKKALGGGALLDESHWIDQMLWLFGAPAKLFAKLGTISDLKIETDDNVDIIATYKNGMQIYLHLDLYGRPHEKSIRFIGEEGSILWTADPNHVLVGKEMTESWETFEFDCERNDMFIDVAREYLKVLDGVPVSTCDIDDGVKALAVVEAVRKSSAVGREVNLSEFGL